MQMHKTNTTIERKVKVPYNIIDTRNQCWHPFCYCVRTVKATCLHRQIYSSQRELSQGVEYHEKAIGGTFDIRVYLRGISVAAISGRSICVFPHFWEEYQCF